MEGKGAWLVASYEINMHEALLEEPLSASTMRNARTESIVLHTRQLCEMFLSLDGKNEDNVKLEDLISDKEQSEQLKELIGELRQSYGNRRTAKSPCWVFNKMLLHPTKIRVDRYDYRPALDQVRPSLKKIIAEIESKRGRFDRSL